MSSQHALIIDDDKSNLEVLGRLLESLGLSHTALHDPTELEAAMDEIDQLDVVFLDLEMPKMDGYETFNLLQDGGVDVPVVAYTVHTSEVNAVRNMGFHSFIAKPIDLKRFPDQLQRILSGQPVWDFK